MVGLAAPETCGCAEVVAQEWEEEEGEGGRVVEEGGATVGAGLWAADCAWQRRSSRAAYRSEAGGRPCRGR